MQKSDVAQLQSMMRTYGSYTVVAEITKYMTELCRMHYINSPDSVINRDLPIMVEATTKLKNNHPLREL